MIESLKDKLIQGKWYKFYLKEFKNYWVFSSLEYFSKKHAELIELLVYTSYVYNTPILFLERIDKYKCLKFFYEGKIIYCGQDIRFRFDECKEI